ncbi:MAG: hypothetical protein IJQ52_03375 [Bacteroidales bacterium]|nr:hypothetical protein [Bacteroidales bacterium]
MAGLSRARVKGLCPFNPLSLRDIPLSGGTTRTCCATLAEPGWLHCFDVFDISLTFRHGG